jgi:hypothetical protein
MPTYAVVVRKAETTLYDMKSSACDTPNPKASMADRMAERCVRGWGEVDRARSARSCYSLCCAICADSPLRAGATVYPHYVHEIGLAADSADVA